MKSSKQIYDIHVLNVICDKINNWSHIDVQNF